MKLGQIDRLLLKTTYLVAAAVVFFQVLGQDTLVSLMFTLTFPLTILLWLRSVWKTLTGMDLLMLLTALLATVFVLLDMWRAEGVLSFSYLKKLVMFIMTLLFLQAADRFRVDQGMVRFVDRLTDVLTLFLIAMYFLQRTQMYLFNGIVTTYLTFQFTNPNLAGLFLVSFYMLKLYRLFSPEKWYVKLIQVVMAAFLVYFVLETQSRNCLIVMILATLVCVWLIFRGRRHMRISGFVAAVVAWFPALFAAGYMVLIKSQWIQDVFSFLVEEGKQLSSRTRIWTNALQTIGESPLIGAYFSISDETGAAHMHNTHLEIAGSYGVPVLVLVCTLLTKYLHQRGREYSSKSEYFYILCFVCTLILGMGESALFSGGLGIYIFIGTFLLLSHQQAPDQVLKS